MANALFIEVGDLAKFTSMNGSIDTDKTKQLIYLAQQLHIQNYLGTDLYDRFNDDIVAGGSPVGATYIALMTDYIKPMVIWFTFYEYLKFAPYEVSNKGVFRHSSENSEVLDVTHINSLEDKAKAVAEHYSKRFVDHMCFNSSSFTEYNSNSNGDMYPDKDVNFTNWFL